MADFPSVSMPPVLSSQDMLAVDRAMIEDYGIELIQMMENAGRSLAHLLRARFFEGDPRGRRVTIFAGSGGNGGGALVAARRLSSWGAHVTVRLSVPEAQLQPEPAHQLAILRRMDVPISAEAADLSLDGDTDALIDGLIGYRLAGPPRGAAAQLISRANAHPADVLALDVPSGLDASDGTVHQPAIEATATLTLALPKHGLLVESARENVGDLYLADIGVPPELYSGLSLQSPGALFAESDIVRLF